MFIHTCAPSTKYKPAAASFSGEKAVQFPRLGTMLSPGLGDLGTSKACIQDLTIRKHRKKL